MHPITNTFQHPFSKGSSGGNFTKTEKMKFDKSISAIVLGAVFTLFPFIVMHLKLDDITFSPYLDDWSAFGSYAGFIVGSIIIFLTYISINQNQKNYELQTKISYASLYKNDIIKLIHLLTRTSILFIAVQENLNIDPQQIKFLKEQFSEDNKSDILYNIHCLNYSRLMEFLSEVQKIDDLLKDKNLVPNKLNNNTLEKIKDITDSVEVLVRNLKSDIHIH